MKFKRFLCSIFGHKWEIYVNPVDEPGFDPPARYVDDYCVRCGRRAYNPRLWPSSIAIERI